MNSKIEHVETLVLYWKNSAEQNYTTMQNLLKSKDNSWALFIGHLVLEKLLKAVFVRKKEQHAGFTHDLLRIATQAELLITDEHANWFDHITTFNLNARYDSYKNEFHKICTPEYTLTWVGRIETLRLWLIQQL